MMNVRYERQPMASPFGLRDRPGQPGAATAERVSRGGEPDSESSSAMALASPNEAADEAGQTLAPASGRGRFATFLPVLRHN